MKAEGSIYSIGSFALVFAASVGFAQCPGDCPTNHQMIVEACETRFDAHCAVMAFPEPGRYLIGGTGALITPKHVLTAKHLLPGEGEGFSGTIGTVEPFTRQAFFFRRREDGTAAPTDVAPQNLDPNEVLYRTSINIIYTGRNDHVIFELDEAIDPALIPPLEVTAQFFFTDLEQEANSEPSPPARSTKSAAIETAGWGVGDSTVPDDDHSASRLRWRCGSATWIDTDSGILNHAAGSLHDSGTPLSFEMPNGAKRIVSVLTQAIGLSSVRQDRVASGAESRVLPLGVSETYSLPNGTSVFYRNGDWKDVTGDASPHGLAHGRPDMILDLNDVVFVRFGIDSNDPSFDFTSSSDPAHVNYAVPDGLVNETDWLYYLHRFTNDPHPYTSGPVVIPRCDSLDTDGDNRLSGVDIATIASLVGASGASVKAWDFDQDGTLEIAELSALQAAAAAFPVNPLGDINRDGVYDGLDIHLLRVPPGVDHDTWNSQLWENLVDIDAGYRIELDVDLDGDNDYADLARIVVDSVPGDFVHATNAANGAFALSYADVDWDVTNEDIWSLLSAQDGNAGGRRSRLIDATGSADPSDPAYGVPDGIADRLDVAFWLSTRFDDSNFDSVGSQLLKSPVDPNGDGRINFKDFQWYKNNDGLSANIPAFSDLDGNGVIEFGPDQDAGRIFQQLTDIEETNDVVVARFDRVLGSVPKGSRLNPFSADAHRYDHGILGDWNLSEDRTRQCFEDVTETDPTGFEFEVRIYSTDFCPPDIGTGTPSADCTDYCEMLDAISAGDFAFDGRRFGEDGYRFTMDWDLDGDNDTDDEPYIKQRQFPGDVNFDGVATGADWNAWTTLFANGDLLADSNFDGNLTGADWNAFLNAQLTPCSCP